MASSRQILANRRNSTLSRGAQTPEGRESSAQNAITHGMSACKLAHPDDVPLVAARLDDWKVELHPVGPYQRPLAAKFVICSLREERCRMNEDAARCLLSCRAGRQTWDDDRNAEVEALAAGLARRPAVVASQLRRTTH